VQVVGAEELKRKLEKMQAEVRERAVEEALRAGALIIQNAAKQKVPRVTSTLARSIHTEYDAGNKGVLIGTNLEYAAQVEFGGTIYPKTKKLLSWINKATGERVFAKSVTQRARPYLRPAWDENIDKAKEEIRRVLKMMLEQATK